MSQKVRIYGQTAPKHLLYVLICLTNGHDGRCKISLVETFAVHRKVFLGDSIRRNLSLSKANSHWTTFGFFRLLRPYCIKCNFPSLITDSAPFSVSSSGQYKQVQTIS